MMMKMKQMYPMFDLCNKTFFKAQYYYTYTNTAKYYSFKPLLANTREKEEEKITKKKQYRNYEENEE